MVQKSSTGPLFDELIQLMHEKKISYSYLPGEDVKRKFEGKLNFDDSFDGYFEENGAVIMANLAREVLVVSLHASVAVLTLNDCEVFHFNQ